MTDAPRTNPDLTLVLTEEEWKASMPVVTRDMTEYLARYRTPVFKDQRDHGEGWGSGSFVEVDGSKYILTNEHVATIRHSDQQLGFQLADQETLVVIRGNHVQQGPPWDLALLPVSEASLDQPKTRL